MKSRDALLAVAAAGGVLLVLRGRAGASALPQRSAAAPLLASPPPKREGPQLDPDEATDDETALARMLASETRKSEARIVIGWLTVQRARRSHLDLYKFVTSGKGYGPQNEGRYASTAKAPTTETRLIAQRILAGELVPSGAIRAHTPGSWVERNAGVADERVLDLQNQWHEGIYGRVAGTRWLLYSRDTAPISQVPYDSASARLDALPVVPALDRAVA